MGIANQESSSDIMLGSFLLFSHSLQGVVSIFIFNILSIIKALNPLRLNAIYYT